ncbi:MAG: hypothetical protein HYY23_20175 [Verrucomicrobia bacterium]|nr:hypothetical protein [Verrucomicrobiota bacterium]
MERVFTRLALAPAFLSAILSWQAAAAEAAQQTGTTARAAALANDTRDAILLNNGDTLYGSLQLIDPTIGVRWRHPSAAEVIEFISDQVSEVRFGYRPQPQNDSINSCQVRLSNQDEIEGNLLSIDAERVTLETWYAGKMEIARKFVQSVAPKPMERPPVFEGPAGLEGWTMGLVQTVPNAGQWSYKNGAFYATQSASIARDLKLPDVASIQFDLNWKGMLYIAVALYTDYMQPINLQTKETGPDFGGFYSLQLNSYTVNLLPVSKQEPLRYLGQTSVPALNQKSKVHVEIRVNKPKRMIALMVDGLLVKQWIDTDDFVGKGTGVRFVHQGQGSVKLSNIRVTEWDGQFDEKPSAAPESKTDLGRLQNGDKVSGDLQRVQDSKVTFALPEGSTLDIPLNRVKLLQMAGQKMERPPDNTSTVRATFRRGGSLTFRLEKWDQQEVIGSSPGLGKLILNPAAFERVQFYPIARPKPTARATPMGPPIPMAIQRDRIFVPGGGRAVIRGERLFIDGGRAVIFDRGRAMVRPVAAEGNWR